MIAICNSLSMFATKKDSDIDLFIVSEAKMIWFVRFFVTLIFWKNGVWRKWEDIAGNFCLSFFVTENALDMSKIAIQDDYYMYFWVYFLKPIVDYNETYSRFVWENSWVEIDDIQQKENRKYIFISGKTKKISKIFYFFNNCIRFFLKRKTEKNFEKMNRPFWVIISDNILKFHDKDQREYIKKVVNNREKYVKNF